MDYESTIALTLGAITDDRAPLSDETFNRVFLNAEKAMKLTIEKCPGYKPSLNEIRSITLWCYKDYLVTRCINEMTVTSLRTQVFDCLQDVDLDKQTRSPCCGQADGETDQHRHPIAAPGRLCRQQGPREICLCSVHRERGTRKRLCSSTFVLISLYFLFVWTKEPSA